MSFTKSFALLLLCLSLTAFANADTTEYRYLTEKFAEYGASLEHCEALKNKNERMDDQTLAALKSYELPAVRVFLVGREYQLQDECAKDTLLPLLIAVLSLEHVEMQAKARQVHQGIRDMLFPGNRWTLEEKYRALPAEMRAELEALPFFQSQFDSLDALDRLEQER